MGVGLTTGVLDLVELLEAVLLVLGGVELLIVIELFLLGGLVGGLRGGLGLLLFLGFEALLLLGDLLAVARREVTNLHYKKH